MKRVISLTLSLLFLLLAPSLLAGCGDEDYTNYVCLEVEGFGDIVIELRPDMAPKTVKNFQKLVAQGFYDGLTFHRIDEGFMIQGGCPNGNGTGGAGDTVKGEFASNGVTTNTLSHTRGTISMARADGYPNSASSQFFIMHGSNTSLDGKYAAFGTVISGIEVVDAIASVATWGETPLTPVVIKKAYFIYPEETT